jgi:hypothetical protein
MNKSFVSQKRPNASFKEAHFGLKIQAAGGFIFPTREITGVVYINDSCVFDISKLREV